MEKITFLPFDKFAKHQQYVIKLDNFVPFGRPQSCSVIIQLMTELGVSNNYILEQHSKTVEKAKKCAYFYD